MVQASPNAVSPPVNAPSTTMSHQTQTIILVIMVLFSTACLFVAIYIPLTYKPKCPQKEMLYDNGMCRPVCDSVTQGLQWSSEANACLPICPTGFQWSPSLQKCVPICPSGTSNLEWDDKTKTCVVDKCDPPPSIDPKSGLVVNASHFRPDQPTGPPTSSSTCGDGTPKQLNALCLVSGWDAGYNSTNKRCQRQQDCATEPCDAAYCLSPTVTNAFRGVTIQKVKNPDNDQCINPSAETIAQLCTQQTSDTVQYVWNPPNDCEMVNLPTSASIKVQLQNAPTTSLIEGTLVHPLVNSNDAPIKYKYVLTRVGTDSTETQVATGICDTSLLPSLSINAVPFKSESQQSSTDTLTVDQTITVPFRIPLSLNYSAVAIYNLYIDGYASWNPNTVMYTLERNDAAPTPLADNFTSNLNSFYSSDVQPNTPVAFTMVLLPASDQVGVTSVLNPVLSGALAQQLATNNGWLTEVTAADGPLKAAMPALIPIQKDSPTVFAATSGSGTDSNDVLIVGCTPAYCDASNGSIMQKMVILAWDTVQVPATDCQKDTASPPENYNASDYEVKYDLSSYYIDGAIPVIKPLISANYTLQNSNQKVQFYVDVVPIRTSVQYLLASYLSPKNSSLTTYANAKCKSQIQFVSFNTEDYTEKFCRGITLNSDKLPPFMWRDPKSGMCTWSGTDQAAQDFYCLFDSPDARTNPTDPNTFNPDGIKFSTGTDCSGILQQWPSHTSEDDHPFDPDIANPTTSSLQTNLYQCMNGVDQTAKVSCLKSVSLETGGLKLNLDDFQTRLDAALNFNAAHPVYDGKDGAALLTPTTLNKITGKGTQQTLWDTKYNHCGPAVSNPRPWGLATDYAGKSVNCDPRDTACSLYASKADCWNNNCLGSKWDKTNDNAELTTFTMHQTTFPTKQYQTDSSPCCNNYGKYTLGILGETSCECDASHDGPQCNGSACAGITCNGHGTCTIDPDNGQPFCACDTNAGYYNVGTTVRPMDKAKDKQDYSNQGSSKCVAPQLCNINETPSQSTRWCIPFEPLMCNTHACPLSTVPCNQATGFNNCSYYSPSDTDDSFRCVN